MPTLAETLKSKGVVISAEIESELPALIEASSEVTALRQTKDDLLKFKQESIAREEAEKAEREAKEAESLAERERLAKENNDQAELLKIETEKLAKLEEKARAAEEKAKVLTESARKSAEKAAIQSVSSLFSDETVGVDIAATKVLTEVGEDGQPKTVFKLGDESFDSVDDFKEKLSSIPSYAKQMKGVDSGGAGAGGGQRKPHTEVKPKSKRTALYMSSVNN